MTATPDHHDGESLRVAQFGFRVGYARGARELERWVDLAELEEALRRSALRHGYPATGGGHLWSRAHTAASSRESLPGWPERVVSPQRSQEVSTAPEGRPRWEKGAKAL
jgi:hypothetical protein